MSPLFGKNDQKAAEVDAAKAEADRLGALTPAELAVELMSVFGPGGPKGRGPDGGINLLQGEAGLLRRRRGPRSTWPSSNRRSGKPCRSSSTPS